MLTILAQLLQDQKVIQVWFVWTAVNIIGVVIYWNSGLYFAFIQQAIFGVANYWGWRDWHRSMVAVDSAAHAVAPAQEVGQRQ